MITRLVLFMERTMNQGKIFEKSFAASMPKDIYFQRLIDPAASFGGSDVTRFSPHQPYDFYAFDSPKFFAMELKSTAGSLTFWREDFEKDGKKNTYEIKKCQINGLTEAAKHDGVVAGFYINFRNVNETFFLSIEDFHLLTDRLDKKSINYKDVSKYGKKIEQKLMKTNYKYDLRKFFDEMLSI